MISFKYAVMTHLLNDSAVDLSCCGYECPFLSYSMMQRRCFSVLSMLSNASIHPHNHPCFSYNPNWPSRCLRELSRCKGRPILLAVAMVHMAKGNTHIWLHSCCMCRLNYHSTLHTLLRVIAFYLEQEACTPLFSIARVHVVSCTSELALVVRALAFRVLSKWQLNTPAKKAC